MFNVAQVWDGRAADLKAQAKGPVQAGVELANTPDNVVATPSSMPAFVEAFETSFDASFDEGGSFDNMAKAIEAFQAMPIAPAPFDAYLDGDEAALSDAQKAGLELFMDKGCVACHAGINVVGEGHFPFGLIEKSAPMGSPRATRAGSRSPTRRMTNTSSAWVRTAISR